MPGEYYSLIISFYIDGTWTCNTNPGELSFLILFLFSSLYFFDFSWIYTIASYSLHVLLMENAYVEGWWWPSFLWDDYDYLSLTGEDYLSGVLVNEGI